MRFIDFSKSKIDRYVKWSDLRKLESLKVIQSMYIWIVVVPVFSKIFSRIGLVSFEINGSHYDLDFSLPFSWKLFFIAALLFSIGSSIFLFFSPSIVKDNKDYGDFCRAGKGIDYLKAYAINLGGDAHLLVSIRDEYKEENGDSEQSIFWNVFNRGDKGRSYLIRLAVGLIYLVGLLLMGFVFIQNIIWVFESM